MQRFKGRSSREVLLRFPDLRDKESESPFWQKGYGSHAVALAEIPTIRQYVQNQQDHHGE
jgi:REP element-mobilizing transposase RayT